MVAHRVLDSAGRFGALSLAAAPCSAENHPLSRVAMVDVSVTVSSGTPTIHILFRRNLDSRSSHLFSNFESSAVNCSIFVFSWTTSSVQAESNSSFTPIAPFSVVNSASEAVLSVASFVFTDCKSALMVEKSSPKAARTSDLKISAISCRKVATSSSFRASVSIPCGPALWEVEPWGGEEVPVAVVTTCGEGLCCWAVARALAFLLALIHHQKRTNSKDKTQVSFHKKVLINNNLNQVLREHVNTRPNPLVAQQRPSLPWLS